MLILVMRTVAAANVQLAAMQNGGICVLAWVLFYIYDFTLI